MKGSTAVKGMRFVSTDKAAKHRQNNVNDEARFPFQVVT
jgi:hypothetical protein